MTNSKERVTVSLSPSLRADIKYYADRNDISFSMAIEELCENAIANEADASFAPRVTELVQREGEYLLNRIDDRFLVYLDALEERIYKRFLSILENENRK